MILDDGSFDELFTVDKIWLLRMHCYHCCLLTIMMLVVSGSSCPKSHVSLSRLSAQRISEAPIMTQFVIVLDSFFLLRPSTASPMNLFLGESLAMELLMFD